MYDICSVPILFPLGCVKITPAHDHNDYECGKRNDLEFIEMIDDDGLITVCDQFKVRSLDSLDATCIACLCKI